MISVKKNKHAEGFTLLEVMLTVVLLAIGFLIAAKMQVHSLRSSQSSQMQANALLISSEIMDKMRNNPAGVENGHYDNKSTSADTVTPCEASGCTPAQLAAQDLFELSAHFVDVRGMGTGYIPSLPGVSATAPASATISDPVDDVYTISINWQGFVEGNSTAETLAIKFIP